MLGSFLLIHWCSPIQVPCLDPQKDSPSVLPLVMDHGGEEGLTPLIYGNHCILTLGTE